MPNMSSTAELPSANYLPGEVTVSPTKTKNKPAPPAQVWAYRLLWITFIMFLASTIAGKLWDRVWHATVRFENFWSPPHFFVFVMTSITSLLVAIVALTPRLRVWFGPAVRLPVIKLEVPGSLVILGSGLVALCTTIILDNFWHTAYGLDETQWSVPHCMLNWAWLTIIFGFVAARMAFRDYRPINWITNMVMALMVLSFLCPAVLGPFYLMYSPNLVNALRTIPIVMTEPSAQHMYRIYLQFDLTRQTHIAFIPFVAFFAGCALTFLRQMDARARIFVLAPIIWSVMFLGRDLYTILFLHYGGARKVIDIIPIALAEPSLWMPIPLVIAIFSYLLLKKSSFTEHRILGITGFIFAICTFFIWHSATWMILLTIPAAFTMIAGAWTGRWIYHLLEKPSMDGLTRFLLSTCAQIPAILGVIDLIMRKNTP